MFETAGCVGARAATDLLGHLLVDMDTRAVIPGHVLVVKC